MSILPKISKTAWIFLGFYFFLPRITLVGLHFLAPWFEKLHINQLVLIAGCLFMPYTLLCWSLVQAFAVSWNIWYVMCLMLGIALDAAYLLLNDN
jgi:hypothetical protein